MAINFIGLDILDEAESGTFTSYGNRFYSKLSKYMKDPLIILHIKKMKSTGKRCKYSVHGRVENPALLASVEYSDWDLIRTLTKTFEKIENEIEHRFKTEGKTERISFKKSIKE